MEGFVDAFDVGSEEKTEVKGRLSPRPEPLEGWSGRFLGPGTMQDGVSGRSEGRESVFGRITLRAAYWICKWEGQVGVSVCLWLS